MSAPIDKQRLASTRQAATIAGVSLDTIRRAAKAGILEPVRIGPRGHLRFRLADLERLIAGQR